MSGISTAPDSPTARESGKRLIGAGGLCFGLGLRCSAKGFVLPVGGRAGDRQPAPALGGLKLLTSRLSLPSVSCLRCPGIMQTLLHILLLQKAGRMMLILQLRKLRLIEIK